VGETIEKALFGGKRRRIVKGIVRIALTMTNFEGGQL